MKFTYYQDEKHQWRWRLLRGDGTALVNAGAGYDNEQKCIEVIEGIIGPGGHSSIERTEEMLGGSIGVACSIGEPNLGTITEAERSRTTHETVDARLPNRPDAIRASEEGTSIRSNGNGVVEATQSRDSNGSQLLIVDLMLGESAVAEVFTTKDNQLRWKYKANRGIVPAMLQDAIDDFDSLMIAISVSIPRQYQKETYHRLGKALFAAFNTPEHANPRAHFHAVRSFVARKAKERARFVYVRASLTCALALGLLAVPAYMFLLNPDIRLIALCAWFGCIGASISVLQRNSSLDIDPWMGDAYLKLQGTARIILGCVFGCIFVLASKANFVLGVVRDNTYPLLVLCLVAGFSERLIPELLSKFESTNISAGKVKDNAQQE